MSVPAASAAAPVIAAQPAPGASPPVTVTVTPRAFGRIAQVLAGEPAGSVLRVAVDGGGCSGFQYVFEVAAGPESDDLVLREGAATVVIDPVSLPYLAGSAIDFVDDLIGQSFKVSNPNATASCGCGTSFAM
jgi:iron-sulfur cluster assembly accessory protein